MDGDVFLPDDEHFQSYTNLIIIAGCILNQGYIITFQQHSA